MSYFRNIQNDGRWELGGTYTFEFFYERISTTATTDDHIYVTVSERDIIEGDLSKYEPDALRYGILFTNSGGSTVGLVDVTDYGSYYSLDRGDGSNGWKTGSITIPINLPVGSYYLKSGLVTFTGEIH